jgi:NaMN:DMB phosphoribosyltransferase
VDVLDLSVTGDLVEAPPDEPRPATEPRPGGRLATLSGWWDRVAPGGVAPSRVLQLWVDAPVTLAPPVRADVTTAPLAVPGSVAEAYAWGSAAADAAADDGTDLLLVSVPAAGPARALAAHLLSMDPVDAMGWPAQSGLRDDEWIEAVAALRDAMRPLRGLHGTPGPLLAALGSPVIAAGTGVLLQAAVRRTPVLLDGAGAAACALQAYRVTRRARGWWQAGHGTGTVLHDRTLKELRLEPLTRLGALPDDGTGARLGLAVLEAATADRLP